MNVKQLKSIIKDLPGEYKVEISINEEGAPSRRRCY